MTMVLFAAERQADGGSHIRVQAESVTWQSCCMTSGHRSAPLGGSRRREDVPNGGSEQGTDCV